MPKDEIGQKIDQLKREFGVSARRKSSVQGTTIRFEIYRRDSLFSVWDGEKFLSRVKEIFGDSVVSAHIWEKGSVLKGSEPYCRGVTVVLSNDPVFRKPLIKRAETSSLLFKLNSDGRNVAKSMDGIVDDIRVFPTNYRQCAYLNRSYSKNTGRPLKRPIETGTIELTVAHGREDKYTDDELQREVYPIFIQKIKEYFGDRLVKPEIGRDPHNTYYSYINIIVKLDGQDGYEYVSSESQKIDQVIDQLLEESDE